MYEHSRVGANYDLLIANLDLLHKRRRERGLNTLFNVRLMIRPSTVGCYRVERDFWRRWADTVMKQYVEKLPESDYAEDVYLSAEEARVLRSPAAPSPSRTYRSEPTATYRSVPSSDRWSRHTHGGSSAT